MSVADGTTIQVQFHLAESRQEALLSDLLDLGFEGFEQRDEALIGFVPDTAWEAVKPAVAALAAPGGLYPCEWDSTLVPPRNWNAEWERGIVPVQAGPFFVHPPWCTPPDGASAICIEPKMSFGTGHHETTRLVLTLLERVVREGDRVLDAGTGTGVLAIAALRLGASSVDAFDIDPWSVENGTENAHRNGVADRIRLIEGDLDAVPGGPYHLVLANINRNVLLGMLDGFRSRLASGGRLVLSGVLKTDEGVMRPALRGAGFRIDAEAVEGEWWALAARLA